MKSQDRKIWRDSPISTTRRVQHNRQDLVVWKHEEKQCYIIDDSVPLDSNMKAKEKEKLDAYMPLLTELKSLYPQYKFQILPVIIGAIGVIHNNLKHQLMSI